MPHLLPHTAVVVVRHTVLQVLPLLVLPTSPDSLLMPQEVHHTVDVLAHRTVAAAGTAAGQGVLLPAAMPVHLQGPCCAGLLVLFELKYGSLSHNP